MEIEHRSLACKATAVPTVPHGGAYAPLIKMIGKCIFYLMFDFKNFIGKEMRTCQILDVVICSGK